MNFRYELNDAAELRQLQSAMRHDLRTGPTPRVFTSPRLLRQFLGCQLQDLTMNFNCENHEMLLLPNQSFQSQHTWFVSAVCARCRHHFHVKSDFQHCRDYSKEHRYHMLIPCDQKSADGLSTVYDEPVSYARYICVYDDCLFGIEIYSMPPKISQSDVMKLGDKSRIARNLASAKANDPERYADFVETQGTGSYGMLRKYLADALKRNRHESPLRINKCNKKFFVSMSNDFDDLLKFLGFYEKEDAETGEPFWYITHPDDRQDVTPVRTLRARMEDALAELEILTHGTTSPAWDKLVQAFQGDFPPCDVDSAYISSIREDDLALLGCLESYPPLSFSWAAVLLAKLRPKDRDKYLHAGLCCIQHRSEEATTEIVVYSSRFDTPAKFQEALAFFGVSSTSDKTPDWFLVTYYEMARANPTDAFKAQAQQYLEIIGNYLGHDIVSQIDPTVLRTFEVSEFTPSSHNGLGRRMSFSSAAKLLNVETNYTPEIIHGFVNQSVNDASVDRSKIVEAINVLSDLKRDQGELKQAEELHQLADFVNETGDVPMLHPQSPSLPNPTTSIDTPPGLKNIGNTCYLNSLLQYFYNVKVVRDLVLNFDQLKLQLDEQEVEQRRTGGNGTTVNIEEAIVARQFVEMLRGLFADLQTTTDTAAQPSQKLANTALSSARDILDQQSQSKPPPLPARPTIAPPIPPKENDDTVNEVVNDVVNITVEPVNDKLETASSRSSQTLVDDETLIPSTQLETPDDKASVVLQQNEDVEMQDSTESCTLDEKIAQVSRRLEHSDRSGTSQQDVGEIIGNILEHLMRAIRPDGPMPEKPELQADKITKTFFTTIVNTTVKTRKGYPASNPVPYLVESPLNVEIVPERWITAYPEEADQASDGTAYNPGGATNVSCTLYAALDRYFSYEPIDEGNRARYSSIRTLPPIVHICIQRSTPRGKNKNPVIIPEILFLDRYMEAEKGSPVWLARKRVWAIKERLKELDAKTIIQSVQSVPILPTEHRDKNIIISWSIDEKEWGFDDENAEDLATMATVALDNTTEEEATLQEAFFKDSDLQRKRKLSDALEPTLIKRLSSSSLPINEPRISDKFSDIVWEGSAPLDELSRRELVDLQKREEITFDAMTKEKYNIHAVICHRGGTAAGHYWVWIRDFKRNAWYRYNDETVTEDSRDTEAVLKDLNEAGDPYYVAYVRDEIKDDLVDVPQRRKPESEGTPATDREVEMIEGVAYDSAPDVFTGTSG
ncbi:cysteine proteinase [Hypoxylon crocopeplum]|nr:cysteine proteinase [Hypoxylon crocopeplum]